MGFRMFMVNLTIVVAVGVGVGSHPTQLSETSKQLVKQECSMHFGRVFCACFVGARPPHVEHGSQLERLRFSSFAWGRSDGT